MVGLTVLNTKGSLAEVLDEHTVAGQLCTPEGERIRCFACGHRCLIGAGKRGICKVRFNRADCLKVPYGYVGAIQCDPVEKKPYFHVYPGSDALTFGMMGCDYHCPYCQNWVTSQALRDTSARAPVMEATPGQLVELAQRNRARLVVSSYNEPLITAEWAVAVFRQAKPAGYCCGFVSNGNCTPEVLDYLKPWISAYKIDLKGFDRKGYATLGGQLQNVLDGIRMVHERGIWLEVLTLVIPGFNSDDEQLRRISAFIASIDPDIPWHVTAFHKDYKMTDPDDTRPEHLLRATEIGTQAGLRYIYAGNLPGEVNRWENTRCPDCRATLIDRYGYLVRDYRLTNDGRCPDCNARIPGIWPTGGREEVTIGHSMQAYYQQIPRRAW